MKPIAIFFHGLFWLGQPPRHMPNAGCIISDQITQMINSGLWDAAQEIHFGINGGSESEAPAKSIIPPKATVRYHGLNSQSENLTIVMMEEWVKTHPGWNVIYLHGKGTSHDPNSEYARRVSKPWREAMMADLVVNWRQCVADLEAGYDVACMVWLWNQGWDQSQHYAAGTFFWASSDFLAKLPSIYLRERIKLDGIGAASSRFEAEVWIGNGPRPNVKAYRPRLPF
jgi:hypothetical protein